MLRRAVQWGALAVAVAAGLHPAQLSAADTVGHSMHATPAFAPSSVLSVRRSFVGLNSAPALCMPSRALRLKHAVVGATKRGIISAQMAEKMDHKQAFMPKHVFPKLLAPALLLAVAIGFPAVSPAELTTEQKVAAQVWTVVDQGFVDRTFNNQDWMSLRQKVVKRNYESREEAYEVISNDLLKPLGDQYTRFINPTKYEALRTSIVGGKGQDVSGIGVTLSIDKKAQVCTHSRSHDVRSHASHPATRHACSYRGTTLHTARQDR